MSEIKTDKLTGTSTAGSILVTGENISGNNTTTNLQQGLAKAWLYYASQATVDSLNISGVTDTGTGVLDIAFANDFGNSNWSGHHTTDYQQPYLSDQARANGTAKLLNRNASDALVDATAGNATFHGDLG